MAEFEVTTSVTVGRSPQEVYRYWRNIENLPRFMRHIESVSPLDGRRSHWVLRGPGGVSLEWDAETVVDQEGQCIAWRSLPGSEVVNRGLVRFVKAPGDRGTEVHARILYRPPGGAAARLFARLFNQATGKLIQEDLRHFKQIMEAGEIATADGQPSGRMQAKEAGA